ncbi:rhomboid family intramembrane serine protease [Tropicibacter naphthalenivorans]|uniref:Rhomboid family protein n=1 Tax=Tropicibacter naphthalenivorans TaxID=441103 RepID=A0A0P1GB70_9RHOB|nr:rhomboid family intramembrane serine protease [Tropicibacter naphthalenivorans]CUH78698.1 Rhomboid family protein [Tropicibacter naphthalenivorans]SMC81266.1 Rhomboid family protein [Tropicibacter naphthalenivorans]
MQHPHNEAPVNPLPPAVLGLFVVMMGIEAAFSLGERSLIGGPGAVGWRTGALEAYGFSGTVFDWMVENGVWPIEHLARFVTYAFLHVAFSHALFGMVLTLALGKAVAEVVGNLGFLAIFFVSSAVGALCWGLVLDDPRILAGAYPGAYGLIGAFTFLLFQKLKRKGAPPFRAFALIGALAVIQLIMWLGTGRQGTEWLADLFAFACGFGLAIVLAPGGWAHALNVIRRR